MNLETLRLARAKALMAAHHNPAMKPRRMPAMSDAVEAALDAWGPSDQPPAWHKFGTDHANRLRAQMQRALAAADKAREVSDEELRSLARMASKFGDDWIAALHTAGLKVVRA